MAEAPLGEMVSLARAARLRESKNYYGPDPIVEMWKCRTPTCISRVGVPQFVRDVLKMFNEHLARSRQRVIANHEVMLCENCAMLRGQP